MNKIRLIIIAIYLLCITSYGQSDNSFERYLSKFKSADNKTLGNQDFYIGISDGFQLASSEEVVKYIQLDKGIPIDTYFSCLYKVEHDEYVITIVATVLDALYSEELFSIIVYSKQDGTIHDRLDMPKRMYGHFNNYSGSLNPFELIVKQSHLVPPQVMRLGYPYPCTYDIYSYTIDTNFKICRTLLEHNIEGLIEVETSSDMYFHILSEDKGRQKYKALVKEIESQQSFEAFLSLFKENNDNITTDQFSASADQISPYYVDWYIQYPTCGECNPGMISYYPIGKISYDHYFVLIVRESCSEPSDQGTYPYDEVMILTYDLNGSLIDKKRVGRTGDLWQYELSLQIEPFRLLAKQATALNDNVESYPLPSKITSKEYIIENNRKIGERILEVKEGLIDWDKEKSQQMIVQN